MPTLLSINNYHYVRGGAEFVFLEHNKMFKDLGWEVVPFSMKHKSNLDSAWEDYFVDEIELGSEYGFVERLDVVALNPRIGELVEPYLDEIDQQALANPRVHQHFIDPRRFVNKAQSSQVYDLIIVDAPDPITAFSKLAAVSPLLTTPVAMVKVRPPPSSVKRIVSPLVSPPSPPSMTSMPPLP